MVAVPDLDTARAFSCAMAVYIDFRLFVGIPIAHWTIVCQQRLFATATSASTASTSVRTRRTIHNPTVRATMSISVETEDINLLHIRSQRHCLIHREQGPIAYPVGFHQRIQFFLPFSLIASIVVARQARLRFTFRFQTWHRFDTQQAAPPL